MSPLARDLLTKLLEIDPIDRIAAKEILQHSWVKNHLTLQKVSHAQKYASLEVEVQRLFLEA
jgi:serine/threonine protein kinase